ncbi:hypothetical protein AAE478_000401 [Parahypoxylon ruwenzoriense]
MPPPLSVSSKAVIHALQGIALGTSCAIGVIMEDRRRRISTLRTAIANKEKLKSAKRYHGVAESALRLDDAVFVGGDELQWHQLEDRNKLRSEHAGLQPQPLRRRDPSGYPSPNTGPALPLESDHVLEPSPASNAAQTPRPSPPSVQGSTTSPSDSSRRPLITSTQIRDHFQAINTPRPWKYDGTISSKPHSVNPHGLIKKVAEILDGESEDKLDRAIAKFFEGYHTYYYSLTQLDDECIAISARLSRECQASGRWEDANKVIAATIGAGPLEESQFYAHDPISIIKFHLRQAGGDGRCPVAAVAAASQIFLAPFKEKPRMCASEVERVGKQLFTANLLACQLPVTHQIYWRIFGLLEDPDAFTEWSIQELFEHKDYKSVIKYFILNYSRTKPDNESYNKTIDCVVYSVEAMDGRKANLVIRAFGRMGCPGKGFLRTRWIMRLLQAYWRRCENLSMVEALFEEVSSLGLLDRINHPQGVYRTMIEITVKAREEAKTRSYYEVLTEKYPDMIRDVALRGFLALVKAEAGDWDGVFDAFTEMQPMRPGKEKEYDDAFIMILKVFAASHPVAEVRDFVTKYTGVLDVRMHHYIVTMLANKYGDCHDMSGFISWLQHCSEAGFALDASLCNAVLYNCWSKWKLSFPELHDVYRQMRAINPCFTNNVTRRIMSQAALAQGKRINESKNDHLVHSKTIAVNKLAYTGRTTSRRDIYEAMNQELNNGKPMIAVSIYTRALKFGMPPCPHCLRLAVLGALKSSDNGSGRAMELIGNAHKRGDDVSSAVSMFIKYQLNHFQAKSEDIILLMRNLVSRFEALRIIIDSAVVTQMAMVFVKLGSHEKAIRLCTYAKIQGGHENLCFSRQSIRALLTAYAYTLDVKGMGKLIEDLLVSEYSTDKLVLSHLKAARRTVQKIRGKVGKALFEILDRGTKLVSARRTETRKDGNMISQETLRIMKDALADMLKTRATTGEQHLGAGQDMGSISEAYPDDDGLGSVTM